MRGEARGEEPCGFALLVIKDCIVSISMFQLYSYHSCHPSTGVLVLSSNLAGPMPNQPELSILVLGTGAGVTYTYHQEPSSSFVVLVDGKPTLLADAGVGVVWACIKHLGQVPDTVYISHNHADHSGDLTVMLAMESNRGRNMRVFSHPAVQSRLQQHRLHELISTGKDLNEFASWHPCPEENQVRVTDDISIHTVKTRHSELCYGFVLYWRGIPKLGWSADSGYDEALYTTLSEAQTLLMDARAQGIAEHASFEEVAILGRKLISQSKRVFATGYGRQSEAPGADVDLGGAEVVRPGQCIKL